MRSPRIYNLEDLLVADLFVPSTHIWNVDLLRDFFSEEDVGTYSVKSAYKMASALVFDREVAERDEWKRLWSLKIPPKVKSWFLACL
ncbi:hypothetical protein ACS0TY_006151 [Phlomoides rotata]